MDGLEPGAVQLELKYCERCGGLWLRLRGSDLVFCWACAKIVAGIGPRHEGKESRTVPEDSMSADSHRRFWGEGGNA